MLNNKKIVIVLPAYNAAKTLERTYKEIPFDIVDDVVLVDDVSKDNTIEVANQLVGFISCHVQHLLHHIGLVGEIQELYIAPTHRNQQLGRQLVTHLESLALDEGWINLEVTTNQKRADTQRFYEQLGFRPTHVKFVKNL